MSEPMDVHTWFELTYAQYLTVPRSVLQAMPEEWQHRFVACLDELDETFDWRPSIGRYWVQLKDAQGRYATDRFMEYRRPDLAYIESKRRPVPDMGEPYPATEPDEDAAYEYAREQALEDAR